MSVAQGIYFDGASGARRSVTLQFADALIIRDGEVQVACWPFTDMRREDASAGRMRLSCLSADPLSRLELRDSAVIAAVERTCPALGSGAPGADRGKIAAWSVAAAVSLVVVAYFGIPALAARLTAWVPPSVEARFGDIVDDQLRGLLTQIDENAYRCDEETVHSQAQAILDGLAPRLAAASGVSEAPRIAVLRMPVANAIALPGGRVYIFSPLLEELAGGDELVGILAHEMGHVAHRDGLRRVMESSGFAILFGFFIGDFGGSAVIVAASEFLTDAAFSREAEQAADDFAVDVMMRLGLKPSALADALERIAPTQTGDKITAVLQSHPLTEERAARLRARAGAANGVAMLAAQDWSLLQRYCTDAQDGADE